MRYQSYLRKASTITLWFITAIALTFQVAQARIEVREFASAEQEATYNHLIQVLRCPKCQNQNLADSDAPLAQDLREKIYSQLNEGLNSEEIQTYMIARYGDFVTYKPPFRWKTAALWILPWAIVIIVGGALYRRTRQTAEPQSQLSQTESDKIASILKNHGTSNDQSESSK